MRQEFIECLLANDVPFNPVPSTRMNRADSVTVYSKTKKHGKFGRPYIRVSGFGRKDGRYRVTSFGYSRYVQFPELIGLVEELNK